MNEAIDYEKLRAAEYSLRIRYAYSLYMHQFYGGGGGGGGGARPREKTYNLQQTLGKKQTIVKQPASMSA